VRYLVENFQSAENELNDKKKKFELLTTDKIKQILELKKNLDILEKPNEDKDKIIEILREEINLINRMNQKVIEEKERNILKLKTLLREKDKKIEALKKLLKRETNLPFL
jgi:hypothetical protein